MNRLLRTLHPMFDALSAYADQGELEGARTRVGRHVSGCAGCRDTVTEIRALGDAARAMPVNSAPAGLWARIVSAAAEPHRLEPSLLPAVERSRRLPRMPAGLAAGAVAAAIVAAVAWPRPAGLQAAGTSRLTFTPVRPVPGGAVTVRYQASPWMRDAPRLILVGTFAKPTGTNPSPFGVSVFGGLGDSLGVLTRSADGAFVATVRLPSDFLAVRLGVLDPEQDRNDLDGFQPWIIVGGTAARAPSFASFLAALDVRRPGSFRGDERLRPGQAVDAADSLKRHFPRHPAGWAFSRSYGLSNGRFDLLRFFSSAERKYASMFDELWPQRGLDAERLHDMVVFAQNIDEPDEVLRWSARLVDEHPEDPRALADLTGALHTIELRMPPSLADSMRRWMPALDRAYRAGPVPNEGFEEALRLATSYGDSATKALWRGRSDANSGFANIWMMMHRVPQPGRDEPAMELRRRSARACVLPPARLPLGEPIHRWTTRCERYRGMAYSGLSSHTLASGNPRLALAEADSAVAASRRGGSCSTALGSLAHARASLALGDTAMAERDYVMYGAAYARSRSDAADTARTRLGARFDSMRFLSGVDSVRRAVTACAEAERAKRRAWDGRPGG